MRKFKVLFFVLFLSTFFFNKNTFFLSPGVPGMEDPMGDFPPPEPMLIPSEAPGVKPPPPPIPVERPVMPVSVVQQPPVPVKVLPPMQGVSMLPPGQISPVPIAQQPMPGFPPAPVIPVGPPVTESQMPLIRVDGKQVNLSESTASLTKVSNVEEMQVVLEQAKLIMQDIKNVLNEIENIGKDFENKFKNTDKQLDLLYQTIGFERGMQTEKLYAK